MGRTSEQRLAYFEDVIRGAEPSSTVPLSLEEQGAATDSPLPPQEESEEQQAPLGRPNVRQPGFLEKYRSEIMKTVISVVITGVLGVSIALVISLNREVGEQKQANQGITRELELLRDRVSRTEERTERQLTNQGGSIDALRTKLENVRDRLSQIAASIRARGGKN